MTADFTSNTMSVLFGNGNGSFQARVSFTDCTGLVHIAGISVATQSAALAAQGQIDAYLINVNAVTGIIGAATSRFETAARTVGVSSENFRAAESRIRDADIAEEAAHLVKYRILQQAGAAVLAQANQAPALALRLLQLG